MSQSVELQSSGAVHDRSQVLATAIDEVAVAINEGLNAPLNFPPLSMAFVPGDRIVLAVDPTVPRLAEVVRGTVDYLMAHGFEASSIAVVVATHTESEVPKCLSALSPEIQSQIKAKRHLPLQQDELGYLAASGEEGLPIYINRWLLDADIVLPITCARGETSLDYVGPSGIFPLFTDSTTQRRFHTLGNLGSSELHRKRRQEADEACWLLGIQCVIQVVPGSGGSIAQINIGDPPTVDDKSQETCRQLWTTSVSKGYSMVVAAIDGGASQQSWDNVARAVYVARQACEPNGTVLLCTELSTNPGKSLVRLASSESQEKIQRAISNDDSYDSLAASVLLEATQSGRVLLLSQLPRESVEEMGMGFVEEAATIDRLVAGQERVLLLGSAQYQLVERS